MENTSHIESTLLTQQNSYYSQFLSAPEKKKKSAALRIQLF